ncbi:MnhB domain-containing protein [Roseimicrobium sp. ORNL1]|uniref:MnhB domain-containing protein n=1 Tax=Roseimicrobium sp. ORNL1 TaxID=2711231 RepID=UPI0013E1443C|nr:MnhB domain-containing protein [Roseimicrobium sp. ORNL1]QIF01817.1 Na(+)/H(+) antiporter subunit B [Roseimicrobium sp. ORNL1]
MIRTPDSFLLRACIQLVFLLVNIVSVYLLFRGHNLPGGGFIAGLMTGTSCILLGLARGWNVLRHQLPVDPLRLAISGVTLALVTGLLPVVVGQQFLTQYMWHLHHVPLIGELHIGTPLLFDVGVFLLVSGMTVKLITVLVRSTAGLPPFSREEHQLYASVMEEPIEDIEKKHPEKKRKETEDAD